MLPMMDVAFPIWLSPARQGNGRAYRLQQKSLLAPLTFVGMAEALAEEMQCLSLENTVLFPWQQTAQSRFGQSCLQSGMEKKIREKNLTATEWRQSKLIKLAYTEVVSAL